MLDVPASLAPGPGTAVLGLLRPREQVPGTAVLGLLNRSREQVPHQFLHGSGPVFVARRSLIY